MVLNNDRYFQHFKGGIYKLLLIAKDSESLETVVVYQAMYGQHEIWTRPASSFFSNVKRDNGPERQRFRELTKEEFLCLQLKTENI